MIRGEQPPRQQRVALASVDVYLISVFTVTVDVVFTVERLVFFKRFVRAKVVSIDDQRFLLTVGQ